MAKEDCCHNHHSHSESSTFRLMLVIIFNITITLAEYIGGMLSGSLALLSDAGHNFSDVLSLILGYVGEKVSEKKPTREYSFGLKRVEVLVALINAIALIGIGIYIVHEAVSRFVHPQSVNLKIMLPIATIGLLGNLLSIIILLKSKGSNLNMRAAFLHLLYDTISSVAVIIGAVILYFTNWILIDTIISLGVVIMIFWSSISIISESIRIFLQGIPTNLDPVEVLKSIKSVDGVNEVHCLHIWSINSNETFLSCHICLKGETSPSNSDKIINAINSILKSVHKIKHTTLQLENNKVCSENYCNNCYK